MNCISIQAGENIRNNTICVYDKESDVILNMKFKRDLEDKLVYVSNVQPITEECESFVIKKGEYCRCIFVNISERFMME